MPEVEAYYVLCGILGICLISIVVSAAIWRSGYINNKYSFRRLPGAPVCSNSGAKKSHTVNSQLGSDVPSGYVVCMLFKFLYLLFSFIFFI